MFLAKVHSLANQGARVIRKVPGPRRRSFFEVLHRLEPRTILRESTRVYGQITGRHTQNQNLRRQRQRQKQKQKQRHRQRQRHRW